MTWSPIPISVVTSPNSAFAAYNSSTSLPTGVAAGSSANTKGAWTEIFASTSFNATVIELIMGTTGGSGFALHTLCDIGIGAAGSETVLVPNIAVGVADGMRRYTLPIWVPAGSRVAVRLQINSPSSSANVQLGLYSTGHSQTETGSSAASIGTATATSAGTSLTLASTINTMSTWTQLTASTASAIRSLLLTAQGPSTGSYSANINAIFEIGTGTPGNEVVLIGGQYLYWNTNELTNNAPLTIPVNLPSGTRIVARYQASATNQAPVVSVVGFS